jgi:hypothetical protein
MIPAPPMDAAGELVLSATQVADALVPGTLSACCACRRGSIWHWFHEGRYVALHATCAPRLVEEWRELIANGQTASVQTTGKLAGAYARRAAARSGASRPPARAVSASLGSPYFIPGMPEGAPWVAVADMPGDVPLVTPCGLNETHARYVNGKRRAATAHGFAPRLGDPLPLGGWVVGPDGGISDRWDARELSSRVDSAKLAG